MKKSWVVLSPIVVLGLIMTSQSASFGEDNRQNGQNNQSSQAGKEQENSSRTFSAIGVRSHGEPTRDWSINLATPSSMSIFSPSVATDQPGADDNWVSQNYTKTQAAPKPVAFALGGTAANPITCHGACEVLIGGTNKTISIIPVWVGGWDTAINGNLDKWNEILGNLINSYGTTKPTDHVFNTNKKYFPASNPPALKWLGHRNVVALKTTATKNRHNFYNVSDNDVATYINSYISSNKTPVPAGTTPVYVYIGASNTQLSSGFGTQYCGWHSYGNTATGKQTFIAIQDFTSTYFGSCSVQTVSPNNNVALDATASVFAHEVDETITDPFLNAWYDSRGAENADKCAWTFGTTLPVGAPANVAKYNVTYGSYKYLIQQNWLADNLITPTGLATGTACSVK
jgi:hypothetical protein